MLNIKKKFLFEQKKYSNVVRTLVRDIITIFKKEDDGEFYLPEEIKPDELEYNFPDFDLSLELIIDPDDNVSDFLLNADLYRRENIITVLIKYNPKNKNTILYNLIGHLNEILGHEVRHIVQKNRNLFNMSIDDDNDDEEVSDDEKSGIEYYSEPEEIDAQVFGFRRMKKATNQPFEKLVSDWFEKNKDIHQLDPNEVKIVIDKILDYNSKI